MSRAEKRAKRIIGPPPKKPRPLERAVHGDFEYRSEVRRYKIGFTTKPLLKGRKLGVK